MGAKLGMKHHNRHAPPGMHWCCRCQRFLRVKSFDECTKGRHGLDGYCKSCKSEWHKNWLEGLTEGERMRKSWTATRWREKSKGPYELTFEQYARRRVDPCVACIALGLDCDSCADPSTLREVDKITANRKIGYTWGNTQSLCWFHNRLKSDGMTTEALLDLAKTEPDRFQKCRETTNGFQRCKKAVDGRSKKKHAPSRDQMIAQKKFAFPAPPEAPKRPISEPQPSLFEVGLKAKAV